MNRIQEVPEVCAIFCATANPVEAIVAETEQGRGVLGVIDGSSPKGIETPVLGLALGGSYDRPARGGTISCTVGNPRDDTVQAVLRLALVENEQRLRQAARQIGRCLKPEKAVK